MESNFNFLAIKKIKLNNAHYVALLVLIASIPLFYFLPQQELKYWDEARELNEAYWWLGHKLPITEMDSLIIKDDPAYNIPTSLKSLNVWAISFSMLFFGRTYLAGQVVTAFFSILIIMLFYFFALEYIKNRTIAFFGSLILLFNPTYFFYSLTSLSEIMTLFFVILSFFLYKKFLKKRENPLFLLVGISAGLAFMTKEFGLIALFIILANEIYILFRKKTKNLKQYLFLFLGFFLVIFFVWLIYFLNNLDLFSIFLARFAILDPGSFLIKLLLPNYTQNVFIINQSADVYHLTNLMEIFYISSMYFLSIIITYPFILFLIICGIFYWRIKKNFIDSLVTIWFFLPLLLFLFYNYPELRNFLVIVPALSLIAIFGIKFIYDFTCNVSLSPKIKKALIFLIIFYYAFITIPVIHDLSSIKSNYDNLGKILLDEKAKITVSTDPPITSFYTLNKSIYLKSLNKTSPFFDCNIDCFKNLDKNIITHIIIGDHAKEDPLIKEFKKRCKPFIKIDSKWMDTINIYRTNECPEVFANK